MRCREADDPFTKLGQYLFALHSLCRRFSRMITPVAGCRRNWTGQAATGQEPTSGDSSRTARGRTLQPPPLLPTAISAAAYSAGTLKETAPPADILL